METNFVNLINNSFLCHKEAENPCYIHFVFPENRKKRKVLQLIV